MRMKVKIRARVQDSNPTGELDHVVNKGARRGPSQERPISSH